MRRLPESPVGNHHSGQIKQRPARQFACSVPIRLDDDGNPTFEKCLCAAAPRATDAELVTGFHPGAHVSAVVDRLYFSKLLPRPTRDPSPGTDVGSGFFSGNRQDAGQFAHSLQRTSQEILLRWAIMRVFQGRRWLPNIQTLRDNLAPRLNANSFFNEAGMSMSRV